MQPSTVVMQCDTSRDINEVTTVDNMNNIKATT